LLLGELRARGFTSKFLAVGSALGLRAARRGECDVAGVHLFDPSTGEYNRPFLTPELELIPGYGRLQGVVFRRGDVRFEGRAPHAAVADVRDDPRCLMINRNQGSGTRVLIDGLLDGREPAGFAVQARSHNAVAAAVAQGRADWGVAIENVARLYGLGFLPLQAEQYDLVTPVARRNRPAVVALRQVLSEPAVRERLRVAGFRVETS
jgi:putative molybdopterin biosynthesis protein